MYLEFRCCHINHQGSEALLLSISDVTESRLLGSKLGRLLESFPDLVCTFDRSNHFVDVSTASTRILGFDPFELVGPHVYQLVHPADRRRMSWRRTLFEGGDPTSDSNVVACISPANFGWVMWSAAYSQSTT